MRTFKYNEPATFNLMNASHPPVMGYRITRRNLIAYLTASVRSCTRIEFHSWLRRGRKRTISSKISADAPYPASKFLSNAYSSRNKHIPD